MSLFPTRDKFGRTVIGMREAEELVHSWPHVLVIAAVDNRIGEYEFTMTGERSAVFVLKVEVGGDNEEVVLSWMQKLPGLARAMQRVLLKKKADAEAAEAARDRAIAEEFRAGGEGG